MKIALVSLNQAWENKKVNLAMCTEFIKKASNENVDLIVFPEMTLTGFSIDISKTAEDENQSETIKEFRNLSKEYNIAILFGMVIKAGNKALNKALFVRSDGEVLGTYAKIHPFSFAKEEEHFNSGNELKIVKFKDINIGLSICYDLRFPELYSALSKNSDLVINIANWPKKRVEHWNTLLKARAIENQMFMIGVNRTGEDGNNLQYEESSAVYDADGKKLIFEQIDEMKIYNIDVNFTKKYKSHFNTTIDRKTDFYKDIL